MTTDRLEPNTLHTRGDTTRPPYGSMYQSLSYNTDKAIAPQKHWNTSHKQACQHAQNLALRHLTSQHIQHQKRLQPKKFKACTPTLPILLAFVLGTGTPHKRRATITQAWVGCHQAVQAFCICCAAADVLALVSCRTSSARHLFCLLRISLDNFCADTRVVCWCPNDSAYNGKQQHTKNRATQLHDNTVESPAGASQLECKLWCWNCGSCALLAHETHKMLCNPGHLYSGSAATKNPYTSPHC